MSAMSPVSFLEQAGAWIECLPTCQNAANPPRYAPVRAGEYIRSKLKVSMIGEAGQSSRRSQTQIKFQSSPAEDTATSWL